MGELRSRAKGRVRETLDLSGERIENTSGFSESHAFREDPPETRASISNHLGSTVPFLEGTSGPESLYRVTSLRRERSPFPKPEHRVMQFAEEMQLLPKVLL